MSFNDQENPPAIVVGFLVSVAVSLVLKRGWRVGWAKYILQNGWR